MRKITNEDILSVEGLSSRLAARELGVGKTAINDARRRLAQGTLEPAVKVPRILTVDIESKPHTVYTWGLWDQNVGINQIKEAGGMISFAAKWLGDDDVLFYSEYHDGLLPMIHAIWNLLSEADIVITYNGDRYDFKRLNNEFLLHGMTPPAPYQSIDLIKTNRNRFDLPSRKLDYLVQSMGVGAKVKHQGFDLWVDCMAGDPEAWEKMKEYNIGDVIVTEGAYLQLLPWLTSTPHYALFTGDIAACPYCGSKEVTENGTTHTKVQSYQLFQCADCGGWMRGTTPLGVKIATRAIR